MSAKIAVDLRVNNLATSSRVLTERSMYLPGTALAGLMRWVVFPVLVSAGLLMWQAARLRQALTRISRLPSARSGAS